VREWQSLNCIRSVGKPNSDQVSPIFISTIGCRDRFVIKSSTSGEPDDTMGVDQDYDPHAHELWTQIHDIMAREIGQLRLGDYGQVSTRCQG